MYNVTLIREYFIKPIIIFADWQLFLGILNVTKYHEVLQKLFDTYGPIVKEKIGPTTLIHIFDPDNAKTIYQSEGKMPFVVPLQETAQLYRQKTNMSPGLGNM